MLTAVIHLLYIKNVRMVFLKMGLDESFSYPIFFLYANNKTPKREISLKTHSSLSFIE